MSTQPTPPTAPFADAARCELSKVYQWIESNHPDGFIDSQSHWQNLERVTDYHQARLDQKDAEIKAMRVAVQEAHKIIEVLYMDALDAHKESWPRANEWMQKHAALTKLQPFTVPTL